MEPLNERRRDRLGVEPVGQLVRVRIEPVRAGFLAPPAFSAALCSRELVVWHLELTGSPVVR